MTSFKKREQITIDIHLLRLAIIQVGRNNQNGRRFSYGYKFNQMQHLNAFWKRFAIVLHGKILKKYFFKTAEIFKMAALIL
jgi:hypothetical protein